MSEQVLTTPVLYAELEAIYEARALGRYGLTLLNQQMHAVQAAALARAANLPASLVVAALLHDIGHMVHDLGEHPAAQGIDDQHESIGAAWLARHFGPAVSEPVRLHVAAKRYLCATEAAYTGSLSPDSLESLWLQGGPMSASELRLFRAEPFFSDAVTLRRIDEAAKDPDGPLPSFASFRAQIDEATQEIQRERRE